MNLEQFNKQLAREPLPQVIDFWAPWCVPCKVTKPILDKLGAEYRGKVKFRAINADQHPQLLQALKIMGIPTLLIVRNGKIVKRYTGAQSEATYRQIFAALASDGQMDLVLSRGERIIRLALGASLLLFALLSQIYWLTGVGLLLLYLAYYDRCPAWQALRARLFKKR